MSNKIRQRMAQLEAMSKDTSSPHEAAIAAERLRKMKEQHKDVSPQQPEYKRTFDSEEYLRRERNVGKLPDWFWPEYQNQGLYWTFSAAERFLKMNRSQEEDAEFIAVNVYRAAASKMEKAVIEWALAQRAQSTRRMSPYLAEIDDFTKAQYRKTVNAMPEVKACRAAFKAYRAAHKAHQEARDRAHKPRTTPYNQTQDFLNGVIAIIRRDHWARPDFCELLVAKVRLEFNERVAAAASAE